MTALGLLSAGKVRCLGRVVLGERLDPQSTFGGLMNRPYRYNGRLPMFGQLCQDLGEVDSADRSTGSDCLNHRVGATLIL